PEEQQDRWTHDGDLADEPGRAVRDLGRARLAIARATRRLPGKTLRDRAPVRQMILVDAGAGEPSSELRAGAARERKTGRELDGTGRLSDDHDAVGRSSGDDRKCAWDVPGVRAS